MRLRETQLDVPPISLLNKMSVKVDFFLCWGTKIAAYGIHKTTLRLEADDKSHKKKDGTLLLKSRSTVFGH